MLSNTSPLHVPVFEQMYLEKAGKAMKDVFKKIYYSYEIGWHKPDKEAWEYVIKDAGIVPEETLFLDDNIHNIKASQELGFQAIHIHERTRLNGPGFRPVIHRGLFYNSASAIRRLSTQLDPQSKSSISSPSWFSIFTLAFVIVTFRVRPR